HHGLASAYDAQREAIFRFKSYNLYRRHEPFYQAYPEAMERRLLPDDYARFVQCWNEVDVRMQDVYPITPHLTEQIESTTLKFDAHMVEIPHLDRLLFVAYYEPKEDGAGNRQRCEAFFSERNSGNQICVRAWDFWEK
ncbi:MAG TPA: hypothetical protein VHL11_16080, partial [Phototrophicaceae bacterium]|nr:hypothetical protein [Phototrophicaceae bacterium]